MLSLLSLNAIAAHRGDGLHPVLLAGLKRLAAERVEQVTFQSISEHNEYATKPNGGADCVREIAKQPRAA